MIVLPSRQKHDRCVCSLILLLPSSSCWSPRVVQGMLWERKKLLSRLSLGAVSAPVNAILKEKNHCATPLIKCCTWERCSGGKTHRHREEARGA